MTEQHEAGRSAFLHRRADGQCGRGRFGRAQRHVVMEKYKRSSSTWWQGRGGSGGCATVGLLAFACERGSFM